MGDARVLPLFVLVDLNGSFVIVHDNVESYIIEFLVSSCNGWLFKCQYSCSVDVSNTVLCGYEVRTQQICWHGSNFDLKFLHEQEG